MAMSYSQNSAPRMQGLRSYMMQVVKGQQDITNSKQASLYIDAICAHPDKVKCIDTLIGEVRGLSALQSALRVDLSKIFINTRLKSLLRYLSAPEVKQISGGSFLRSVIETITDPPIMWRAMVEFARQHELLEETVHAFAWLMLELISLPSHHAKQFYKFAQDKKLLATLLESSNLSTRTLGQKIQHTMRTIQNPTVEGPGGPGGRHDNDHTDFREIKILPTADEVICAEAPFLRVASDIHSYSEETRFATHIDNQFRLNREDMLRDMRDELQILQGSRQGIRRAVLIDDIMLLGIESDRKPWALRLECSKDISRIPHGSPQQRLRWVNDHKNFLKHDSIACLMTGNDITAFVRIRREVDLLSRSPPILIATFADGQNALKKILRNVKDNISMRLLQLNTPVFAYEPVLKQLQCIKHLPLGNDILGIPALEISTKDFSGVLQCETNDDLQSMLDLPKSCMLDPAQALCFEAAISQRLSLILGPPGTGKSFIGALIAKAIFQLSEATILIICFTNHALDQFISDIRNIGIDDEQIVRLGSPAKVSTDNQPLMLFNQKSNHRLVWAQRQQLDQVNKQLDELRTNIRDTYDSIQAKGVTKAELMNGLEFEIAEPIFDAVVTPKDVDGMTHVDARGKAINQYYLLDRWAKGDDAGAFSSLGKEFPSVWQMPKAKRADIIYRIKQKVLDGRVQRLTKLTEQFNAALGIIEHILAERSRAVVKERRIICCTTTGAAKYAGLIQHAKPKVVLVEEAGEILESHILTALSPTTEKLILIGDHKQLRPKVHHELSVEKGSGYDLNCSLFERLVLQGRSVEALHQQHRMRPEISGLVRHLTYPGLVDAPSTQNRAQLRGLQDSVIFVSHQHMEDELMVPDYRDFNSPTSKTNQYEADMTLKCVRYLAQQGYGSSQLVVLTPYVAQLRLLCDTLAHENDPVLNDLDSYDLVRAGLMPAAAANISKRRLRISSIDNYQGEESDIVLISLCRSNQRGDIGFLKQPERLNVLLSRARDGMIIIGNGSMFAEHKKAEQTWGKLMSYLKEHSHIYDGLPVRCERHPYRREILCKPEDFLELCPDGGCTEPCGTKLSCGVHACPHRCHQLDDHSKMPCEHIVKMTCTSGHRYSHKCNASKPVACEHCERIRIQKERDAQKDLERQKRDLESQAEHSAQLQILEDELHDLRDSAGETRKREEMQNAIENKKREVQQAREMRIRAEQRPPDQAPQSPTPAPPLDPSPDIHQSVSSTAEEEWDRRQKVEGASNDAIEAIMKMTGLEEVKSKFLQVMDRVNIAQSQGTDLKKERLGIVLLGNPGTGKTTVARRYAEFLFSLGILPGQCFVETTGSRLANDGVNGAKKHIEDILNAGGGAFFLDEAYQLTSGHNFGGASVLDFLLAEMENQTGKIVFILAGYDRPMEKFFEHNQGLDSRLPYRIRFEDYTDQELLIMFSRSIHQRFRGAMRVEDGHYGLFARIAIKRLGRGRGKEGFGNARALENLIERILQRQTTRLAKERNAGRTVDLLYVSREDLIGPEPGTALVHSTAWTRLQQMIGLNSVKDSVKALMDTMQLNYRREVEEKPIVEVSLNRVFIGSPGTGKTSVGKLYGQVLKEIGVLSNGEVIEKNPSDFLGQAIGESEKNTKAILKATEGKVLIIDEAYMLQGSAAGTDPYRAGIVDTIVAEVQSTPGEDRCVLLLGYKDNMEEWFRNTNPGLARRFPLDDAFEFEDFTDDELRQILDMKLKNQGLLATDQAKDVAIDMLSRARRRANFGNAGEVENLISHAKSSYQKRVSALPVSQRKVDIVFEASDFDENYDRPANAIGNCRKLFEGVVGCDTIVQKLERYMKTAAGLRAKGMDPIENIPFNFIFKGPPGTGKTTTARKFGQIFYDMGFLSTSDVYECSASDLVAGYVGQTALKTKEVLEKALGRVCFIDEAYRLSEGHFATEAINELVDCLTKPKFHGKLLVILAGYENEMNELLSVNPGLESRFPEEIMFNNLSSHDCVKLLEGRIKESRFAIELACHERQKLEHFFDEMMSFPGWGNARDIGVLAKGVVNEALQVNTDPDQTLTISYEQVERVLGNSIQHRRGRAIRPPSGAPSHPQLPLAFGNDERNPQRSSTRSSTTESRQDLLRAQLEQRREPTPETTTEEDIDMGVARDANVSDAVWYQLQRDKQAQQQREADVLQKLKEAEAAAQKAKEKKIERERKLRAINEKQAKDEAEAREIRKRQEQARLKYLRELKALQEAEERARRLKEEEEERRRHEVKVQSKLRHMGVCSQGFQWHKQEGGYRCGGGSHFVSDAHLEG